MPTRKNAHRQICPQGKLPTRKNSHMEKCQHGCYFHLCQSLVRKIQGVGLKSEFECNTECKLLLKSLAALSFVPADDVKVVFGTLAQSFPDKESYNAVLSYFHCTYIEGAAGRTPMFPVKIWNHFDSAIEESPKTTNCCEGFHNELNSVFYCSHPSVWTVWYLFDGLQRDMACHKLTSVNTEAEDLKLKSGSMQINTKFRQNLLESILSRTTH